MTKPKKSISPPPVPPPAPPPISQYAQGMLDALRLMKSARDDMEAPLKRVRDEVGAAYVVLNGATHWGQSLVSEAETRIMRHLIDTEMNAPAKEGA